MSTRKFLLCIKNAIGGLIGCVVCFGVFVYMLYAVLFVLFCESRIGVDKNIFNTVSIYALGIGLLLIYFNLLSTEISDVFSRYAYEKDSEYRKLKSEIDKELDKVRKEFANEKRKCEELQKILKSRTPFSDVTTMMVDLEKYVFDRAEYFLNHKRHPAHGAASDIKRMFDNRYKELFSNWKSTEYKLDFLCGKFPELELAFKSESDLLEITEIADFYTKRDDIIDKRKDFLSKEEYENLSETQKSQLSLDRYIKGRKTNWQIGRDYEMSCAYQLRAQGYSVELHGIKFGLHDLGRDLIASKKIGGLFGNELLIIQCKNWRHERVIRENVIMQLYGSTVAYAIKYHRELNEKIRAVLMIPDYSQLSNTAVEFAQALKIEIIKMNYIDFPRIKCNINNGNRIYHLPFDQQYDRTEIKNTEEFYAFTVDEAERRGFRRAKRYVFN